MSSTTSPQHKRARALVPALNVGATLETRDEGGFDVQELIDGIAAVWKGGVDASATIAQIRQDMPILKASVGVAPVETLLPEGRGVAVPGAAGDRGSVNARSQQQQRQQRQQQREDSVRRTAVARSKRLDPATAEASEKLTKIMKRAVGDVEFTRPWPERAFDPVVDDADIRRAKVSGGTREEDRPAGWVYRGVFPLHDELDFPARLETTLQWLRVPEAWPAPCAARISAFVRSVRCASLARATFWYVCLTLFRLPNGARAPHVADRVRAAPGGTAPGCGPPRAPPRYEDDAEWLVEGPLSNHLAWLVEGGFGRGATRDRLMDTLPYIIGVAGWCAVLDAYPTSRSRLRRRVPCDLFTSVAVSALSGYEPGPQTVKGRLDALFGARPQPTLGDAHVSRLLRVVTGKGLIGGGGGTDGTDGVGGGTSRRGTHRGGTHRQEGHLGAASALRGPHLGGTHRAGTGRRSSVGLSGRPASSHRWGAQAWGTSRAAAGDAWTSRSGAGSDAGWHTGRGFFDLGDEDDEDDEEELELHTAATAAATAAAAAAAAAEGGPGATLAATAAANAAGGGGGLAPRDADSSGPARAASAARERELDRNARRIARWVEFGHVDAPAERSLHDPAGTAARRSRKPLGPRLDPSAGTAILKKFSSHATEVHLARVRAENAAAGYVAPSSSAAAAAAPAASSARVAGPGGGGTVRARVGSPAQRWLREIERASPSAGRGHHPAAPALSPTSSPGSAASSASQDSLASTSSLSTSSSTSSSSLSSTSERRQLPGSPRGDPQSAAAIVAAAAAASGLSGARTHGRRPATASASRRSAGAMTPDAARAGRATLATPSPTRARASRRPGSALALSPSRSPTPSPYASASANAAVAVAVSPAAAVARASRGGGGGGGGLHAGTAASDARRDAGDFSASLGASRAEREAEMRRLQRASASALVAADKLVRDLVRSVDPEVSEAVKETEQRRDEVLNAGAPSVQRFASAELNANAAAHAAKQAALDPSNIFRPSERNAKLRTILRDSRRPPAHAADQGGERAQTSSFGRARSAPRARAGGVAMMPRNRAAKAAAGDGVGAPVVLGPLRHRPGSGRGSLPAGQVRASSAGPSSRPRPGSAAARSAAKSGGVSAASDRAAAFVDALARGEDCAAYARENTRASRAFLRTRLDADAERRSAEDIVRGKLKPVKMLDTVRKPAVETRRVRRGAMAKPGPADAHGAAGAVNFAHGH